MKKRLCAAVFLLLLFLFSACGDKALSPDPEARAGTPVYTPSDPREEWKVSEGFSFTVTGRQVLPARLDRIPLKLASDPGNAFAIALKVEDSGCRLLGQTGLIAPGCFLEELTLDFVVKGGDEITLTVTAYGEDGAPVCSQAIYRTLDVSENG